MRFLSRKDIDAYFTGVASTVAGLPPYMRQARHAFEDRDSYDFAGLLEAGVDALLAPMAEGQPKACAAFRALEPSFLVCERRGVDAIGRDTWTTDAFIGSGDRWFRVGADFRGDSIAESGERSVVHFRYASLSPAIAKAYYWRHTGLEVVNELPSDPFRSHVLPAGITNWGRRGDAFVSGSKRLAQMKMALLSVADAATPPEKDGQTWKSFACVLDSREQGDDGSVGDLLFVQERSASHRIFHVQDRDFENIRRIADPVALFDEYVAWVVSGGEGRFDFTAWREPG